MTRFFQCFDGLHVFGVHFNSFPSWLYLSIQRFGLFHGFNPGPFASKARGFRSQGLTIQKITDEVCATPVGRELCSDASVPLERLGRMKFNDPSSEKTKPSQVDSFVFIKDFRDLVFEHFDFGVSIVEWLNFHPFIYLERHRRVGAGAHDLQEVGKPLQLSFESI